MECYNLPTASEIHEIDLTDSKFWKPIYTEIKRILEQREILKANVCSFGVKINF